MPVSLRFLLGQQVVRVDLLERHLALQLEVLGVEVARLLDPRRLELADGNLAARDLLRVHEAGGHLRGAEGAIRIHFRVALDDVAHALLEALVAKCIVRTLEGGAQEGLEAFRVLGDGVLAGHERGRGDVEAQVGPGREHADVGVLLLRDLANAGLVHDEEGHRVGGAPDERGRHGGRVHAHPRHRVGLEPGELLEDRPENLVAVAGGDRELLALEVLRSLDGRVAPHEDAVRRAPVPEGDGLHLHVGVGARRDERGDVRDAHVALAGGDALHGVARSLPAEDLHVEALVAVEAFLQRGVVRHVLARGHEVEDERVGAQRLLLRAAHHREKHGDGEGGGEKCQRRAGDSDHGHPPWQ
jgi:hypothetical protein